MSYLKHNANGIGKRAAAKKPKRVEDPEAARYGPEAQAKEAAAQANDYRLGVHNSRCIEEALDGLRSVISTYVTQARNGDNGSGLYSSPNAYPVRVALVESDDLTVSLFLEGDAVESIADSLKRIADVLATQRGHTGGAV